jgi:hypothetical protein
MEPEIYFNNYDCKKRVDDALNELIKYFDAVEIFCSRSNEEGTISQCVNKGLGNWYARYGQIKAWVHDSEMERINIKEDL